MNSGIILGNLTADPELVKLENTVKINFSIAYNDPYSKDKEKAANFFNLEMFGNKAEAFAKYHTKGDRVLVRYRLLQDRWEKDGQKRQAVKLKAEDFSFVKTKGDTPAKGETIDKADIPF